MPIYVRVTVLRNKNIFFKCLQVTRTLTSYLKMALSDNLIHNTTLGFTAGRTYWVLCLKHVRTSKESYYLNTIALLYTRWCYFDSGHFVDYDITKWDSSLMSCDLL